MITKTFRDTEIKVKERLSLGEKVSFSDYIVGIVTDMEDLTYSPLYYDVALIQAFFIYYVEGMETPTIQEVDEHLREYKNFIVDVTGHDSGFYLDEYESLVDDVDRMIRFNKDFIIHNQKSSMDEAFESLNTLLSTLNAKAEQLDVKKLDKYLKKLNPQELMKAYQKSGIGNDVRDNAIQEQAKEIKALKNEVSARNVKA